MNIYPAIDLYEGKVVRLARGNYEDITVYSDQPVEVAKEWEKQGAKWLHLVDLEGARDGKPKNLKTVAQIRKAVKAKIQLGGGIRTTHDVKSAIQTGIDRAILGTKALHESFLSQSLTEFGPEKIAVGLDVQDDRVKTQGWLHEGGKSLSEALAFFNRFPLETIIYTDIQKDGMLDGPNFTRLTEVLSVSKARIILSGGIATLEDIQKCVYIEEKNFEGVIIGKAIYEKIFSIADAINLLHEES